MELHVIQYICNTHVQYYAMQLYIWRVNVKREIDAPTSLTEGPLNSRQIGEPVWKWRKRE
jgi:hypothetical protein